MVRKYVIFSILISLFFLLSFPKTSRAEIATVKDWVGLFDPEANTNDYSKSGTITCSGGDGHCWVYTSTCSQTAPAPGAVPKLLAGGSSCIQFNLSPTLAPTNNKTYVFRLMANNGTTSDALISYKTATFGSTTAIINGKLFHVTGDLKIDSDISVNETGVIFVDGNLFINTNLLAYPSGKTAPDPKKGIVFIVKGTIYIDRRVDTVNAFLISHGKDTGNADILPFCSAWDDGTFPAPTHTPACLDFSETDKINRKQLTINGSVISLHPTIKPSFVRRYAIPAGTAEAEKIIYDPKYLTIMKDIFSRDLKIWREIQ